MTLPASSGLPGDLSLFRCSLRSNFPAYARGDRAPQAHGPLVADRSSVAGYLTSSKILKMGMYIATIIDPTMPPRPAIISGSMSAVNDSVVASTSWS